MDAEVLRLSIFLFIYFFQISRVSMTSQFTIGTNFLWFKCMDQTRPFHVDDVLTFWETTCDLSPTPRTTTITYLVWVIHMLISVINHQQKNQNAKMRKVSMICSIANNTIMSHIFSVTGQNVIVTCCKKSTVSMSSKI